MLASLVSLSRRLARAGVARWLGIGSVALAASAAHAQCQNGWLDTPDIPPGGYGANGIVRAATSYDPDGAGPLQPVLVVGGQFTTVGGSVAANNIALWNGSSWQAMGSGMGGAGAIVLSLKVFNGDLIAAGTFTTAGGIAANNIARWNGSFWQPLGAGLTGGSVAVRAMTVFSHLYVTGSFGTAGAISSPGVARWDGSNWISIPAGGPSGNAMTVYQNELYVGGNGSFDGTVLLYRFNGASWSNTPGTLVGKMDPADSFPFIRALTVHDNKLIVGGNFRDVAAFIGCNGIASWDGAANTWGKLGTGMDEPVFALASLFGSLYAGGEFNTAGNMLSPRVARWAGAWSSVNSSVSGGGILSVQAIAGHNGEIIAGGNFASLSGVGANNIARLNDSTFQWLPTTQATPVRAMMGSLILGGDFQVDVGGGEIAKRCLGTNGVAMSPFSDLGGFTGPNGPVHALGTYSPNPFTIAYNVFGGSFTTAGGITTNNIATWRLSTWGTLGSGFNSTVRAVATYGGSLYAAGDFTASGATTCLRIARYVGGAWQPVAGGFNGPVYALFVHGGLLYAGGTFTTAGGNSINYLAAFNGTSWSGVADGLFGNGTGSGVYCMTSYSGNAQGPYLVIGGKFRTNFSNVPNLAAIGSIVAFFQGYGAGFNDTVRAATMYEGDLVVGGDFTQTPGGFMSHIARYDLDVGGWQPMGAGVDSTVYCLRALWDSELHVGGAFTSAGGMYSPHWARFNTTGRPGIHTQPFNQTALGCDASFTVAAPPAYTGLTYHWRRDGVDLADGVQPTGALVSGATAATLNLTNLSNADEGAYSCVVSNACGSTTSASAALNVCGADYNCDGFVDGIDYDEFNNDFEAGEARSDYNGDGFVDGIDYDDFNNDFANGC